MELMTKLPPAYDAFTDSMKKFQAGLQDWYISTDGFRHELRWPRRPDDANTWNRMTTRCIICHEHRTDDYSEAQTQENELIAVEVAHWQMNHRTKCRIPLGALKLG